jgi:GT2 family glycosyltransferase
MITLSNLLREVLIITVIYNKKLSDVDLLTSISNISKNNDLKINVIIYDNSPEYNQCDIPPFPFNFYYNKNISNCGVSQSFNSAADFACKNNFKWLLIFDCDASITTELLVKYLDGINTNPDSALFCPISYCKNILVSPFKRKFHYSFILKNFKHSSTYDKSLAIINSAMLIKTNAFMKIGGYSLNIPLDFSDIYFINRFFKHYDHFVVIDYKLEHKLSGLEYQELDTTLNRYRFYCIGSKEMSLHFYNGFLFYIWALVRGVKLTIKYKSLAFLETFFKIHILNIMRDD